MKILPPEQSKEFEADVSLPDKLSQDERLEECLFSGESYSGMNLKGLDSLRCKFSRCDFSGCSLENAGFRDAVFEGCDFSNCDFTGAGLQRAVFTGCKLTGADFVEASLRHMRFTDCVLEYVNFADAKVLDTAFDKSRMIHAGFLRVNLTAAFAGCDLTQATVQQAPLKGIDLRTCRLSGLWATLPDLHGAIVTPAQASELAALMGLVIREETEEINK